MCASALSRHDFNVKEAARKAYAGLHRTKSPFFKRLRVTILAAAIWCPDVRRFTIFHKQHPIGARMGAGTNTNILAVSTPCGIHSARAWPPAYFSANDTPSRL